jgi:hypothetical protein
MTTDMKEDAMTTDVKVGVKPTVTVGTRTFTVLFPNLVRPLTADEHDSLRESIRAHGRVLVPVVVDERDGVIDGINRLTLAAELGLADVPVDVRTDLTDEQKGRLALALNDARRHLTAEDRRRLAEGRRKRACEKRAQGKSLRAIAAEEGVSLGQVQRDLAESGVSGDTPDGPDSGEDQCEAGEVSPPAPAQSSLFEEPAEPVVPAADPPPKEAPPAPAVDPPKVKGRDGKSYPARKPKGKGEPAPPKTRRIPGVPAALARMIGPDLAIYQVQRLAGAVAKDQLQQLVAAGKEAVLQKVCVLDWVHKAELVENQFHPMRAGKGLAAPEFEMLASEPSDREQALRHLRAARQHLDVWITTIDVWITTIEGWVAATADTEAEARS